MDDYLTRCLAYAVLGGFFYSQFQLLPILFLKNIGLNLLLKEKLIKFT